MLLPLDGLPLPSSGQLHHRDLTKPLFQLQRLRKKQGVELDCHPAGVLSSH